MFGKLWAKALIATDEHAGYRLLNIDYNHARLGTERANMYGQYPYLQHCSFWSLLKRDVMGTHHHMSKKYLPLYLSEFSFRHNNRKNPDIFQDVVAGC